MVLQRKSIGLIGQWSSDIPYKSKVPFKYYVIKRLGGWGKPNDYD